MYTSRSLFGNLFPGMIGVREDTEEQLHEKAYGQ